MKSKTANTPVKIHCEPGYDCRSFMTGDWLDENGHHVMHERTYWLRPPSVKEIQDCPAKLIHYLKSTIRVSYWISDVLYTNKTLAEAEAKQHGFKAQEGFYCEEDNLHWFPIFDDYDKALAFLKIKTGICYESI